MAMLPSSHPADISLSTPVCLVAPRQAQTNAIQHRAVALSKHQRALALTVGTTVGMLLLGLGLTVAVTSLAGARALGGAPAVSRIGVEPVTSLLVSRVLPVVAAVLVGGGLGWLRRSQLREGR